MVSSIVCRLPLNPLCGTTVGVCTGLCGFVVASPCSVRSSYNLFRCTWREAESSRPTAEPEAGGEVEVSPEGDVTSSSDDSSHSGGAKVVPPFHGKFLCYNVWNSNPPRWLWPNPRRRWDLYRSRMDHLTGIVKSEDPDVIGFQEVRYDSTLAYPTQHAQIEHLAERLPGYQYVYQSANLYYDQVRWCGRSGFVVVLMVDVLVCCVFKANFPGRDEEGPAIFSKHPIVNSSYLLLDRDVDDSDDGHHRLCLHAAVQFVAQRCLQPPVWRVSRCTHVGVVDPSGFRGAPWLMCTWFTCHSVSLRATERLPPSGSSCRQRALVLLTCVKWRWAIGCVRNHVS